MPRYETAILKEPTTKTVTGKIFIAADNAGNEELLKENIKTGYRYMPLSKREAEKLEELVTNNPQIELSSLNAQLAKEEILRLKKNGKISRSIN